MNAHAEFHRAAALSARREAHKSFHAAAYERDSPAYKQGEVFERLANQHDLAASGKLTFDDCPNCHNVTAVTR
jgi:cytochrome c2